MKWRWVLVGGGIVTTLGLAAGLTGVGVTNLDKPRQIDELRLENNETVYPVVPPESRKLPKTGPALPSPGYEN